MRSEIVWKWILVGALIGIFPLHPLVMILNHFMNESMGVHSQSVMDVILGETMSALSPKMMLWNLSFAFLGAVAGFYCGRAEQKNKALRNSEEKFRSVTMSATDAIISINNRGKIVFWNGASQKIFGYGEDEIIGQPVTVLMSERYREAHRKGMERLGSASQSHVVGRTVELHGIKKEGIEFPLELSLSTWRTGEETFYTAIIRDISNRKKLEQEKELLILDLKDALANMKTLKGLLPICSYCKNVRDDQGYWNKIEAYVNKHSEAEFSHGICPECARKYYPDMDLSEDAE